MSKKRVAIVGCGGIGGYHLGHLVQFTDIVELVGFCDLIPERAASFVEKAGCGKAFTDFREMYDAVNPEIVFICVPPYCHGEIEFETIERNIPFFVEKPVSLYWDQAMEILAKVKEKNLITAAGFQCRYDMLADPLAEFAKNHPIPYINCTRFGSIPDTPWWIKKELSGGQMVEQTVHQIDYIRYPLGEPETVFSMAGRGYVTDVEGYDTDDLSVAVVKFKNGTLAPIATGCYATDAAVFDSKTTFSAPDAHADMYLLNKLDVFSAEVKKEEVGDLIVKGDGALGKASENKEQIKHSGDSGIICDRTFLEAVISGDPSKIKSPYEDACKTLAFVLAFNESIETGLPVKVKEVK